MVVEMAVFVVLLEIAYLLKDSGHDMVCLEG
jgi:hypothetical protein